MDSNKFGGLSLTQSHSASTRISPHLRLAEQGKVSGKSAMHSYFLTTLVVICSTAAAS
jgi:hypothetical protein